MITYDLLEQIKPEMMKVRHLLGHSISSITINDLRKKIYQINSVKSVCEIYNVIFFIKV